MKIALLGDVHANLHALEAVLEDAEAEDVEAIWNVGDYVGYGAYPDEVVRRLREVEAHAVVGNYDLKVLKFPAKADKWRQTKHPEKWLAFQWAHDNLSPESRRYLSGLPREVRLEVAGRRVLLAHGSPESIEEPISPGTPETRLVELARLAEAEVIVSGHSHQALALQVEGVWFINAGSVGRPDGGDPRATYCILRLTPGGPVVSHKRVVYDAAGAAAAIRRQGLPEVFAWMLQHGWDFDTAVERGLGGVR